MQMAIWNRYKLQLQHSDQSEVAPARLDKSAQGVVSVRLDAHKQFADQLKLIGVRAEDLSIIQIIGKLIAANADQLLAFVYGKLGSQPHLSSIITTNSNLQKHMNILKNHLLDLFGHDIDDAYIEKRIRIAHVHVRVGLEIRYYVAAMQILLDGIVEIARSAGYSENDAMSIVQTAAKLLNFEMQLVLHYYELKVKEDKETIKHNVSAMASELAALSMETSASVQEAVAHTGSAASISRQGTQMADASGSQVDDGLATMGNLLESLAQIRTGMQKITAQVDTLENNASKIQDIAGWVKNIADQTNLLSLNASIEAARAGEHGKGFGVVAAEVKKLAEQTRHSVDSITELIQGTIVEIHGIAEAIRDVDQFSVEIQDKSNTVEHSLHTIMESIHRNRDMNGRIEDDLNNLLKVMEEIGKANETIAASSEKLDDFMKKLV